MAKTSAPINVRNLHYARMTSEDKPGVPPTYAKPKPLSTEAVNVTITPTAVSAKAYGDGIIAEQYEGTNGGSIAMQVHSMPTADASDLFGITVDARGGVVYSDNDVAPYVAIGFETDKANGERVWNWVYKVKMQPPERNVSTKADNVTFNQPTINGNYMSRSDGTYIVDGKPKALHRYEYDEGNESFDPAFAATWFDAVVEPTTTPPTPPAPPPEPKPTE